MCQEFHVNTIPLREFMSDVRLESRLPHFHHKEVNVHGGVRGDLAPQFGYPQSQLCSL